MSTPTSTTPTTVAPEMVHPVLQAVPINKLPPGLSVTVSFDADDNRPSVTGSYVGIDILSELDALKTRVATVEDDNAALTTDNAALTTRVATLTTRVTTLTTDNAALTTRVANVENQNISQQKQLDTQGRMVTVLRRNTNSPAVCPGCGAHETQRLVMLYCGHLMCTQCVGDLGPGRRVPCPFAHEHDDARTAFVRNPVMGTPCKPLIQGPVQGPLQGPGP